MTVRIRVRWWQVGISLLDFACGFSDPGAPLWPDPVIHVEGRWPRARVIVAEFTPNSKARAG